MMHKVSIIVPVYKVEKYLRTCIDSIIGQTYKNIQLILVDDGSPDRCGAICDEYAEEDDRILSLHKSNGGVSSARNMGLQYVSGEFVTFCDSDDLYRADWIEKLVLAMQEASADMALGNFQKISEDGACLSASEHETGMIHMNLPEEKIRYCFEKLLTDKHAWEVTTRLFRTEIIRKNKLMFCGSCNNYAEDLGFALSYSVFADSVISIDSAGYLYRTHSGSMMQSSVDKPKLNAVNEVFLAFEPVFRTAFSQELAEDVLPIFHFLIMMDQYITVIKYGEYHKMRDAVAEIQQKALWEQWARTLLKKKKTMISCFGRYSAERILLLTHFCLHRNGTRFRMERRLFYMLNNKMEDYYGGEK